MTYTNPAVTLSVRIPPKVKDQLEELSDATGRTKSFLAAEAIEGYLMTQAWQIKSIKNSVKKANRKDAKFIDHSQVVEWVSNLGSDEDQGKPQ